MFERGSALREQLFYYVAYGIVLMICAFGLWAAWVQRYDDSLLRLERDLTPAINRIDASVEAANRHITILRASAEAFLSWSTDSNRTSLLDRDVTRSVTYPGYTAKPVMGDTPDETVLLMGHGETPAGTSDKGHEVEMGMVLGQLLPTAREHVPDAVFLYYVSARDFIVAHPSSPAEDAINYMAPEEIALTSAVAHHDFYAMGTPERNPTRRSFWTPPYLDIVGMGLMCTNGSPIYAADGRFLGVVAIDITLEQFSEILRESAVNVGSVALIDRDLRLLGHPTAIAKSDKALRSFAEFFPLVDSPVPFAATIAHAQKGFIAREGWLFRTIAVTGAPWRLVYYVDQSQILWSVIWQMLPLWLMTALLLVALVAFERRRLVVNRLKQMTVDLAQARDEAQSANRIKSSLLANVSHELRTPLNAVLGMSELMRRHLFGPLGSSKYDEYVKDIHRSGEHLLALIDGLLDLTSMEAGRYRLREEELDLADLVEECRRMLAPIASEARVQLTMKVPEDFPAVTADRLALKQILLNLLSNAIKFTPDCGQVALLLAIDDKGALTAAISDNGPGIAPAERPHLFLPFSHGNAEVKNDKQGAGLGLSIVKSLVDLHGGSIAIASDPGQGCTFHITLPRAQPKQRKVA